MSAEPVPQEIRPLRVILREFIQHVVQGEDEIDRDELVAYALKRFESDPEFQVAAVRDVVPIVVPEILRSVVRIMKQTVVEAPRGAVSRKKLDLTARERLQLVFEGTGKGYKSFLALRKRELFALNERDEREINARSRWVAFRAELGAQMNDTQPVGETFTGPQLNEAWRRHFEPKKDD